MGSAPRCLAELARLQKRSWKWRLVGMRLKLPGSVWEIYSKDEETKDWSRRNARNLFEVVVRDCIEEPLLWVVQHQREAPFHIRAEHLLPAVRGKQRRDLLTMDAPLPAAKGSVRPRKASENTESSQPKPDKGSQCTPKSAPAPSCGDDDVGSRIEQTRASKPVPHAAQKTGTRQRKGKPGARRRGQGRTSAPKVRKCDPECAPFVTTAGTGNFPADGQPTGVQPSCNAGKDFFTITVKLKEGMVVPLSVRLGQNPNIVAQQFAQRFGLGPEQTQHISVAVARQQAKHQPRFSGHAASAANFAYAAGGMANMQGQQLLPAGSLSLLHPGRQPQPYMAPVPHAPLPWQSTSLESHSVPPQPGPDTNQNSNLENLLERTVVRIFERI